jgi:hypothetical protein
MTRRLTPHAFEDFLRWLGNANGSRDPQTDTAPPAAVTTTAREAWAAIRDIERSRNESISGRIVAGSHQEEIALLAAADADRSRWLPRLRTPNGFSISALYPSGESTGAAPVGLLVECPSELIEVCRGRLVQIAIGGRWFEIGEIDRDGKAAGNLPAGLEFRPPFAIRVGAIDEQTEELPDTDDSP